MRNKCLEQNYSLNEYYLTNLNNNEKIYLKNEKQIFDILKIDYLQPEERNLINYNKLWYTKFVKIIIFYIYKNGIKFK